jgi:ubiquinone/menaquinone biosynthesis C-methylase UbiE
MFTEISNIAVMSSEEEYKNNLFKFDLQSFLEDHKGSGSLQLKKTFPATYKLLASQLALYPKAMEKLPHFTSKFCYLTSKSYEQSSSEVMAKLKASLYNGDILIDLSGGLGIDDIAFSGSFKNVISVDTDKELNLIAEVNFKKLGIKNIERVSAKAEDIIEQDLSADLIYIDADRRVSKTGKKAVILHDSSPCIPVMLNRLFEISKNILLKLSPLVDITYLKKTLHNIKEIRVVSLNNEVKEILVLLDSAFSEEAEIFAVNVHANGKIQQFSSKHSNKNDISNSDDQKYFFEPAASLVKTGLVKQYADFAGLNPVAANNIYHTTGILPAELFGRVFIIVNQMPFAKSSFRKYLQDNNIVKANISARNFPVKPDEIKKTFKLSDGGDAYFFFTTGTQKNKLVYHCRKIK